MSENRKINDDETSVLEMLAYYDVRGVSDVKLLAIFRCTAEDLSDARKTAEYSEAFSAETSRFEANRAGLDDSWDQLEQRSLGALIESVDLSNDPRLMLNAAMAANKANRRSAASSTELARRAIDVTPPPGSRTTVVRMRASFVDMLQENGGARRMIEREAEISISNTENMREDMSPREVQAMLKSAIGVDPNDMIEVSRFGNTEDQFFDFDPNAAAEFVKK